jgi:AcrR family transcriptional regulator
MRPGGRTERVRKAVVTAVLDRLATGDLSFSFQDIAKSAGVHVATIYARWPDRDALMMASLDEHVRKLTFELSGDWEADLHRIAIALRNFESDPVEIAGNKLLVTSGSVEYRDQVFHHFTGVIKEMATPLEAAKQKGLLRPDSDPVVIINMLLATIVSQVIFIEHVPTDEEISVIVDHLIWSLKA